MQPQLAFPQGKTRSCLLLAERDPMARTHPEGHSLAGSGQKLEGGGLGDGAVRARARRGAGISDVLDFAPLGSGIAKGTGSTGEGEVVAGIVLYNLDG